MKTRWTDWDIRKGNWWNGNLRALKGKPCDRNTNKCKMSWQVDITWIPAKQSRAGTPFHFGFFHSSNFHTEYFSEKNGYIQIKGYKIIESFFISNVSWHTAVDITTAEQNIHRIKHNKPIHVYAVCSSTYGTRTAGNVPVFTRHKQLPASGRNTTFLWKT